MNRITDNILEAASYNLQNCVDLLTYAVKFALVEEGYTPEQIEAVKKLNQQALDVFNGIAKLEK